jgi:hypothetical protein
MLIPMLVATLAVAVPMAGIRVVASRADRGAVIRPKSAGSKE